MKQRDRAYYLNLVQCNRNHEVMPLESLRTMLQSRFPGQEINDIQSIGGGSINDTFKIKVASGDLFCKVNSATKFPHLLLKEKQGLEHISKQKGIKTPGIVEQFETGDYQVLLLEWINEGERTIQFWQRFGIELAQLHAVKNAQFGLQEDNYMGSVEQQNKPSLSWIEFYTKQRIAPLLKKCFNKNLLEKKHLAQFEQLCLSLPSIFDDKEQPSLLHGDLWSGNFLCTVNAEPCLIDPAIYYGHPSMDMAMTTLFGGFHSRFYDAYQSIHPFAPDYKEQWQVCNLYPLLIHLYLFGTDYKTQVEKILTQFN